MGEGNAAATPSGASVRHLRQLGRVPAFDGLRGLAVVLVIWSHIGLIHVIPISDKPDGGFLGVDAFFVLSGFLITALLLREQTRWARFRFGAFYRRRALRLFPVIAAFAIAHYIFSRDLHLSQSVEHSSLLAMIFYFTNWKAAWSPPIALAFGHLWSLAVEEQFYLFWPLVVAVVGVRARTRTVVLVIGGAIVLVALRRAILFEHGVSWARLIIGTDTRADTLLVGALLAHLWVRGVTPKRSVVATAWASTAFLVWCVLRAKPQSGFLYLWGYTAIAVAVAVILLAVLETKWAGARMLALRPMQAIGRVSYGLYVWHPLVFTWVWWETQHWSKFGRGTAVLVATVLVTYASWKLIEQPFLRWKDRLERNASRSRQASSGAPSADSATT